MNLENIKSIYFLGLGGIGMSALARYFHSRGISISGYDKTNTTLTADLEIEGMDIHYDDDYRKIPSSIDLIIYTPAIPNTLGEFIYLKNTGVPMLKRAEVTGLITEGRKTIAVAGTHGKTSISTMTAHILKDAGFPLAALVGGISKNYRTNYISSGNEENTLVEADEYDRSFLHLHPDIAVISAIDPDHLDIYGTETEMSSSFNAFAGNIKQNGHLVIRDGLKVSLRDDIIRIGYSSSENTQITGKNLRIENGMQLFELSGTEPGDHTVSIQVPGRHNVENALAASAICHILGLSTDQIIRGIESFEGVVRRFDVQVKRADRVYIDDYAHHPEELKAFITAVRQFYPGWEVTGLFQPHLYSRTRDFAGGFAESLDMLDEAWLMDIYPAREVPIPGVNSEMIMERMRNKKKRLLSREKVLQELQLSKPQVFLTMGAGDIDQLIEPIKAILG